VGQIARPSFIAIARIVRPRGNRGEVLADLYTDFAARFELLEEIWLEYPDRRRERKLLENSWQHHGRIVLKLSGANSIAEAETLVGAWVEVEADHAVPLPEGTYFDHDLIGCTLYTANGEELGTVSEIMHIPGNDQLVVQGKRQEILIPVRSDICKDVSLERKRIIVELPEGLIDLNK
jgi:16S rRNA processing protein RimM